MTTKEMREVMQAHEDGKTIQFRGKGSEIWRSTPTPAWDWAHREYRIKPEPKYVPYDSVLEVEKDKWFKETITGMLYRITQLDPNDSTVRLALGWNSLEDLFRLYTYEDGTPCGKLVEE